MGLYMCGVSCVDGFGCVIVWYGALPAGSDVIDG